MGLTLEYMAISGKSISQLQEEIPKYFMIKDKIDGTSEQAFRIIRELKRKHANEQISTLDGLKINFDDAWVHIRPSNTEPIIRIVAEAKSQKEVEKILKKFKEEITGLLKWKS